MDNNYVLSALALVAVCTYITRAIPYLLFRKGRIPKNISYLSKVLPMSIMIILVVYCVKHIRIGIYPYGVPELVAVFFVAGVQYFGKKLLLSIALGTALYMGLISFMF